MPDDKLGLLFEPLVRVNDKALRDGYGLGLAIARRAVEVHGGRIHASNRQQGGLCVEVDL